MKCPHCKATFEPSCEVCGKPAKARYCSPKCKQKAYRTKDDVTQGNATVTPSNTSAQPVTRSNEIVRTNVATTSPKPEPVRQLTREEIKQGAILKGNKPFVPRLK